MVYIEIDPKKELPPDTDEWFIVRYNGSAWPKDENSPGEHKGASFHSTPLNSYIKCWLKPIKVLHGEPNAL